VTSDAPGAPPEREPVHDDYDAIVDVATTQGLVTHAVTIAKFTYAFEPRSGNGRLSRVAAEPLRNDFRKFDRVPKVLPGCDFWREKPHVDFVVLGSASPRGGNAVARMEVRAAIDDVEKRIAVFGRRRITWTRDGRVRIGDPEPFASIPLTLPHAYGGIDPRVPSELEDNLLTRMLLVADHPGLYPRNPFGRGYLVDPRPVEDAELEMPNLEDPSDLLSAERLVVRDPRLWWRQPLPWALDFVHPVTFPRYVYFHEGVDAWYPGPEDESMPEVGRGFLPPRFRSELRFPYATAHPLYGQEASYGLTLQSVVGDETATLEGMDAEFPTLGFSLSEVRGHTFDLMLDGRRERIEPRLHSIVVRVADRRVCLVFAATVPLPRPFVPGVHRSIPIALSVDGRRAIVYETPPTIADQLARARQERESGGH
jgi:uncharacterized protein DUF2169